jgi:hypothetical protein
MIRKRKNSASSLRQRRQRDSSENNIMARGIVTIAICAGAGMWGYAMVNLATGAL